MDLNQCTFTGRLGKDPEVRYSQSGTAVCNASLAVSRKFKDTDETVWLKVVAFNKLAETMGEYCSKGQRVLVSGELTINTWEDQQGNTRNDPQIIARQVLFLEKRPERQEQNRPNNNPPPPDDGHIPF